jgi:predicted transposase YdaD
MLFEEFDEKKYMNLFIEEGREEGRNERNKEVAADLLREGNMSASVIARISKLSEENVRQLAISLGVSVL